MKFASACLMAATAALCALGGSAACAGKAQPDVVRLSQTVPLGAPLADALGYFAEQNIKIQWTGTQAHGPAVLVTVIAGENDFAGTVDSAVFLARSRGARLKIIAAQSSPTSSLTDSSGYLVKDGSPIRTPQDFIGKKVVASPTTITWYPLVVWLKRNRVDYHKVNFLTIASPIAALQAFEEGQVDALGASRYGPPGSQLLEQGGVHFFPGVNDTTVLKMSQTSGWVTTEDYLARHPDLVRRFIRALSKAARWANGHPAEAQEILNRFNKLPKQLWRYTKWRPASRDTRLLVDRDSIVKWGRILEDFGQIPPGSIKADDVYTNIYNPEYKAPRS